MAKAQARFVEEITTVTRQDRITLELSQEEAQVLRDILGVAVFGNHFRTRRGLTIKIFAALSDLTDCTPSERDFTGRIEFQETK